MEFFVIVFDGFQSLTIFTKSIVLDVAADLDATVIIDIFTSRRSVSSNSKKMTGYYVMGTQQTFTCSKSTIEFLEQGMKYVQVNNRDIRTTSVTFVLVFLLLTLNLFHTLF